MDKITIQISRGRGANTRKLSVLNLQEVGKIPIHHISKLTNALKVEVEIHAILLVDNNRLEMEIISQKTSLTLCTQITLFIKSYLINLGVGNITIVLKS